MNKLQCDQLIDEYLNWLRQGFSTMSLDEGCELTTPFLDRHNDHLQVYAVKENSKIKLSDDGYMLSDLRTSGFEFNTPKRKDHLILVLNGFGVQIDDDQLIVEASQKNLGQCLHSLIQAMLAINDLFVLSQSRVAGFFWEDVQKYLDKHEIRFSPHVKVAGRTGFDHHIDFLIPKSRQSPERIIKAINRPSRNTVTSFLFTLQDIRESRDNKAEAYAFLNDREVVTSGDMLEALESYNVIPALWSQREQYAQALAR